MSTRLQKKLAEEIVKDVKLKRIRNKKDLLVSAGYDVVTAEASPGRTIEQKGVLEELNNLGFSEEGAKKVVAEILYCEKAKDHDRLDAADKVFKVHGSYAPDKHLNVNVDAEPSPEIRELAKKLNEMYRDAK
jgi:hypothetical protein